MRNTYLHNLEANCSVLAPSISIWLMRWWTQQHWVLVCCLLTCCKFENSHPVDKEWPVGSKQTIRSSPPTACWPLYLCAGLYNKLTVVSWRTAGCVGCAGCAGWAGVVSARRRGLATLLVALLADERSFVVAAGCKGPGVGRVKWFVCFGTFIWLLLELTQM